MGAAQIPAAGTAFVVNILNGRRVPAEQCFESTFLVEKNGPLRNVKVVRKIDFEGFLRFN